MSKRNVVLDELQIFQRFDFYPEKTYYTNGMLLVVCYTTDMENSIRSIESVQENHYQKKLLIYFKTFGARLEAISVHYSQYTLNV